MKPLQKTFIQLAAMILGTLAASSKGANIIDETFGAGAGSFELGSFVATGADFMRLSNGATTITGWTVGGVGGVDWLVEPSHLAFGNLSLDLSGDGGDGSISTSIPTSIGTQYRISFAAYGGGIAQSGLLTAGSLSVPFNAPGTSDPSAAVFTAFDFDFTATSLTTTVSFQSVSSDGFGPVIDDVSITKVPTVPESGSSMLMFGTVLVGFGIFGKFSDRGRRMLGKRQ